MKVLIITDEQYAEIKGSIPPAGLKRKLPGARDLNKMARNGETPEIFESLREQTEALADASEQIRAQMQKALRQADDVGVKPGALARWSGLSARRIHQITREEGGDDE